MMVWLVFIMLLRSRNHGKSSGQSLEPVGSEIFPARRAWDYQKDFNGFLPIRAQKRFVLFDWFVFVHFSRIAEFSDYGEIRIQETMCFITWITINAHKCFINLFSIIFYDNSCVHTVASVSLRRRAYGQFMAIHVQWNIWIRCWIRLDLCHPMTKMSYFGPSVNALCSRYLKIISCWPRTAKSTEGCNLLIISDRL